MRILAAIGCNRPTTMPSCEGVPSPDEAAAQLPPSGEDAAKLPPPLGLNGWALAENVMLHHGHSTGSGPGWGRRASESCGSSDRKGVRAFFSFVPGPASSRYRATHDSRNSCIL